MRYRTSSPFIRLARSTEILRKTLSIPENLRKVIPDIRRAYETGVSLINIAIRFQTAPDIIATILRIPHQTLTPEEASFIVASK